MPRVFAPGTGHSSPDGVSAAKQLILESCDLDLQPAVTLSRTLRDPMDGTAAATEGVQAWANKRGAIEALELRGSEALKHTYLPRMVSGEWTGMFADAVREFGTVDILVSNAGIEPTHPFTR